MPPRSKMVVQYIGNSLMQTIPELVNKRLTDWFTLSRPHVDFTFSEVRRMGVRGRKGEAMGNGRGRNKEEMRKGEEEWRKGGIEVERGRK